MTSQRDYDAMINDRDGSKIRAKVEALKASIGSVMVLPKVGDRVEIGDAKLRGPLIVTASTANVAHDDGCKGRADFFCASDGQRFVVVKWSAVLRSWRIGNFAVSVKVL